MRSYNSFDLPNWLCFHKWLTSNVVVLYRINIKTRSTGYFFRIYRPYVLYLFSYKFWNTNATVALLILSYLYFTLTITIFWWWVSCDLHILIFWTMQKNYLAIVIIFVPTLYFTKNRMGVSRIFDLWTLYLKKILGTCLFWKFAN